MTVENSTCLGFLIIMALINPINYSILYVEIRPQNCTIFVPYVLHATLTNNTSWMFECKQYKNIATVLY